MSLSPRAYRWIAIAALVSLGIIVVTGGAVRLTGSGLGCSDWPNCEPGRLTPHSASDVNAMIEYLNRLFTGVVSVCVALAVLGALIRQPRRRDLTVLSFGLVAGVIGQIVLGGLTVIFELQPQFVMAHFLLSMVLVANATVLVRRTWVPDEPTVMVRASRATRVLARWTAGVAAVLVGAGTIVTGAGPHGGDEFVGRLDLSIETAARVHGVLAVAFIALASITVIRAHRRGEQAVVRAGTWLLGVSIAQTAVGYVQYFTGVPVLLVGIHILGATLVWVAALWTLLSTTTRSRSPSVTNAESTNRASHPTTLEASSSRLGAR